eukprot:comp5537_c0_seq1/m.1463 comp5537_c0_seq1/g.1463  ORF comp5537_c0_seq1/g.1463 comp5537_c0_seq1/m.1463 type:complete len:138 (-) comp5537_c0_seq1:699-1112(-)
MAHRAATADLGLVAEFLAQKAFAVVGASADRSKYGNMVLRNYVKHNKEVVAVNPKGQPIEGIRCVRHLSDLEDPKKYAVSVITHPEVTEEVVSEAARLGIGYMWLQPGSESDRAVAAAQQAGIKILHSGPCVLVCLR